MLLKIMGTLALLSTTAVNAAPATPSKQVAPKVVTKTAPAGKATEVQVAKADDKKGGDTKVAEATDGGTPAPTKKGGGKK
jgi:hypothetical protein